MTKWAFAKSEKVEMRGHKYSAQINRADDLQIYICEKVKFSNSKFCKIFRDYEWTYI